MQNLPAEMVRCPQCGTEMSPALLVCPRCGRLVHAEQLKALAAEAEQCERNGDYPAALAAWRQALELLPPGTRQQQVIVGRIEALASKAPAAAVAPPAGSPSQKGRAGGLAGIGALGLLIWKFKFLALFLLTKAKFLLLGLTKASTFLSMFLSLGVYWTAYGWKFALGLVVSIYIHEMGHVAALRRFGFPATAPMFIPGLGAVIRLKQHPVNPIENSRIGLAGPLWGFGAALAALTIYALTEWPSWLAIARVGAWINLFNLLPVWQLDGARGFSSLNRQQRWLAVAAIGAAWFFTAEGLLLLLLIFGVLQALSPSAPEKPDRTGLAQYVFLLGVLSAMCLLEVPVDGKG